MMPGRSRVHVRVHGPSRLGLVLLTASLTGCSDPVTTPGDGAGRVSIDVPALIVSEPIPAAATATGNQTDGPEVTWVSLPPGSLSGIDWVRIRNETTGYGPTADIRVSDGGFDPVGVVASAGDRLELTFGSVNGQTRVAYTTVPPRRPPVVVRTSPPSGRTDIALNVRPDIIFSEPIDPESLDPATVRLLSGQTPVEISVSRRAGEPWAVDVLPSTRLLPGTTYELVIGPGVRDLQGDSLGSATSVTFSTTVFDPQIAFVSTRDGGPTIYLANADGSAVTRLTEGEAPAWSHDGKRIAFHRGWNYQTWDSRLGTYTIDVDGSNENWISPGFFPSWSLDGRFIALGGPVGETPDAAIYSVTTDGSNQHRELIRDDFVGHGDYADMCYSRTWLSQPSWSPHGGIAFTWGCYGAPRMIYVMDDDGSGARLISNDGWSKVDPALSPDGSAVAAVTYELRPGVQIPHPVIAIYDLANGSRRIVHEVPYDYAGGVDWLPDGENIVFDEFSAPPAPGSELFGSHRRVFILSMRTGALRQLIPDATHPAVADYLDESPAWSPPRR
jgi:Tol biopolymer transport system component